MRPHISYLLAAFAFFASCSDDESRICTTCTSDLTATFEVCRESDGTATVNGERTETDYDLYLEGLEETGVICGN